MDPGESSGGTGSKARGKALEITRRVECFDGLAAIELDRNPVYKPFVTVRIEEGQSMPEVYRGVEGPGGRFHRHVWGFINRPSHSSPFNHPTDTPSPPLPSSKLRDRKSVFRVKKTLPSVISLVIFLALLSGLLGFAQTAYAVPVRFQWNASSGSVQGYKLYQGVQTGTYLSSTPFPGTGTTGTMELDPSASRYVAATAYDSSNRESAFSNEILCHPVTATATTGGTISPSGAFFVQNGNNVTFTITPSSGYRLTALQVGDQYPTITATSSQTTYTVSGVNKLTNVVATFAPGTAQTYAITVTAPTNGTISPSGIIAVGSGGSRSFTITPATGYNIADVRVDGASVGAVSSYTFTNVRANHTISAAFSARTYNITVTSPTNGTISPSGTVSVSHGSSRSFTITPSSGYQIGQVLVDGSSVGAPSSYTFSNVTANHTLAASFSASANKPPIADAGSDQTVAEGVTVTLNGSNSSDPDGTIASYSWTQVSGPAVSLSSTTAARPTFVTPDVGTGGAALTFRLTVTDRAGATASDTCIVNVTWVNQPPTANVGASTISVTEGTSVRLDGSASTDPDNGIASYRWVKKSGPTITLANASTAYATFTAPTVDVNGTSFTFELTVTDKAGLRSTAQKIVNVTNVNAGPKANAGQDKSVSEGEVVTLDGTASTDPDDGIASYRWTQTSGPSASFLTPTTQSVAAFGSPQVGSTGASLTFRLTVTDCGGLQNTDTCVVSVNNVIGPDLGGTWKSFAYDNSAATGTLEVRNSGTVEARSFWIGFYLSTDGKTLSRSIGRKSITSLPAGQAHSLSFKYTRAGLTGQYIIAVLDYLGQVTESSELNNQVAVIIPAVASAALKGTADQSASDGPDLTASWNSMTVSGSMATGSLEVQNVGNVSSRTSYVAFYQSTDGRTQGKYITRGLLGALSPGQTQTLSFRYRESLLSDRYVIAVLDYTNRIQETSELNNHAAISLP